MAENAAQQALAAYGVFWTQVIIVTAKFLALETLGNERRIIIGIIYHAGKHFFLFLSCRTFRLRLSTIPS